MMYVKKVYVVELLGLVLVLNVLNLPVFVNKLVNVYLQQDNVHQLLIYQMEVHVMMIVV